jgi:hypothetical protein
MIDIPKLRRTAWWLFPLLFLISAGSAWLFILDFKPSALLIKKNDPVLYNQLPILLIPGVSVSMFFVLLTAIARYNYREDIAVWFEKWLLRFMLAGLVISSIAYIGNYFLNAYYLRSLGYSYCTDLAPRRPVFASIWVKPADLCVNGKTMDWVREEAAKRASGAASQANPEVNTSK